MGARHQLFIIAKVGPKYRSLAAVHHQVLTGEGPLQRCLRVLRILNTPANRTPILQELRAATGRKEDDEFWATASKDFHPFPFLATCLTVGSSFDPKEGYQNRVHPLAFNVSLRDIDNNEGITVIDVTDPEHLGYCFTMLDGGVKPLPAATYLWWHEKPRDHGWDPDDEDYVPWYEDDEYAFDGEEDERGIQGLSQHPLVQQLDAFHVLGGQELVGWAKHSVVEPVSSEAESCDGVKKMSLRDQAMDQIIDTALKDPNNDPDVLAEVQQLSDFTPRYRRRLLSLAGSGELVVSPALVRCIKLAFSGEGAVDLSSFSSVPSEYLIQASSEILRQGTVKTLNLSHLHQLSEADLMLNFENGATLETLYLLEMPQISPQAVASLWHHPTSAIKDIHHTELLRRPFIKNHTYSSLENMLRSPLVTDLKNPIKNILWARVIVGKNYATDIRKPDGVTVDWQRLKPTSSDIDVKGTMRCAIYPLNDMVLSPTKLVTGLMNYFACAAKDSGYCTSGGLMMTGFTLAKSLAMASTRLLERDGREEVTTIGPLPASMFAAASVSAKVSSLLWPIDFPDMKHGEGALVIVNEHDELKRADGENMERFRLAVVFQDSGGSNAEYRVQSMEEYLNGAVASAEGDKSKGDETASLLACWKRRMDFVEFCESEEIHELLPAMKRNVDWMRKGRKWSHIRGSWDD